MEFILTLFIGILTGFSTGFLGVGGGIIIVPLLPLVFDMGQREVVGTALLTVFFIVLLNTFFFHQRKLIQWKSVLFFGFFTSFGSYFAGLSTIFVDPVLMKSVFVLLICILALMFFFQPSAYSAEDLKWNTDQKSDIVHEHQEGFKDRKKVEEETKVSNKEGKVKKKKLSVFFWSLLSLLSGGASGFTGVGSGALLSLLFIHFNKVAKEKVVPLVQAINMMTSFFGALAFLQLKAVKTNVYLFDFWKWGVVHFDLLIVLSLGALPSAWVGILFQHRMPSRLRKKCLSFLLFVMGVKVFLSMIFDF